MNVNCDYFMEIKQNVNFDLRAFIVIIALCWTEAYYDVLRLILWWWLWYICSFIHISDALLPNRNCFNCKLTVNVNACFGFRNVVFKSRNLLQILQWVSVLPNTLTLVLISVSHELFVLNVCWVWRTQRWAAVWLPAGLYSASRTGSSINTTDTMTRQGASKEGQEFNYHLKWMKHFSL